MDHTRNRPSRPRLRAHDTTTARVLVYDQAETDQVAAAADASAATTTAGATSIATNTAGLTSNAKMEPEHNSGQVIHRRLLSAPKVESKEAPIKSVSTELSNLLRMRNSAIGKSAPSLSIHMRDFNVPRRVANKASHRKSFIATTSPTLPRCHSPLSGTCLTCQHIY
ncbi:uncharacterized protein LOC106640953 [Copidosoma floridanum]|uniref:uncharacterized protein LOC106640953 n=1 Tax=Copidosoma floridanum TaxID=29053 RepID=UPI0006C97F17|nr:uncharacterized protein LOC106640953 [Copidosoma floridanum]